MSRLTGKKALITGGARGIGLTIAEKFIDEGARVALCDIAEDTVRESAEELGGNTHPFVMNVADADNVKAAVKQILDSIGSIDILVNNAGITRDTLMLRMKPDDWAAVIAVNLTGAFNVTQAVVKHMAKARYGRIINMASVVGVMGNPGQANYSASKAGLIGLTKTTAKEFAQRNITANAIAPGYIQTDMTEHLSDEAKEAFLSVIPMKRAGQASDVAAVSVFLASDDSSYVTGQVIHVDGGMIM